MTKILAKYWLASLIIIGLAVAYFALRLPSLTLQPIFADEAIYIRWAQIMKSEPTLRFISLSDGKTPLFMWMMTGVFKLVSDPLLAGRLLSVLFGFITLSGAVTLGWRFFNQRVGLLAGLLVVITPLVFFFDRMALVDTALAACGIWVIVLAFSLAQHPTFRTSTLLGYLMGAALLIKTPGMLNFLSLPSSFLLRNPKYRLLPLLLSWVWAIVTSMVMYNMLRLGPGFVNLSSRNQDYIHPLNRIIDYPLDPLFPHLRDLIDWWPKMMTPPVFVLVLIGIAWTLLFRKKTSLVLLLWIVIPLTIELEYLKTFTARYVLSAVVPLLILAAAASDQILTFLEKETFNKIKWLPILLLIAVLTPVALYYDYQLLTDPHSANLPHEERRGYFEDWTAGPGLKEIGQYLDQKARLKPIVVGTAGAFGTLPDGLMIYLDKTPQLSLVPAQNVIPEDLYQSALLHPTYFVANKASFVGSLSELELIMEFPKALPTQGERPDATQLFEIKSKPR